jgi:hypothetical protein
MSAISATSTASRVRPDIANPRAGATTSKMFGMPAAAIGDATTSVDAGGGGSSPTRTEPSQAAKSLMPGPASTVDFAQQREAGAHPVPAGGPAPADSSDDDDNASPEDRAAGDLDALMNDLTALMGTSSSDSANASSNDADDSFDSLMSVAVDSSSGDVGMDGSTDPGSSDLQTAANQITNDFGSFVDAVLKQYSQTASTGASSDFSGLVAMA